MEWLRMAVGSLVTPQGVSYMVPGEPTTGSRGELYFVAAVWRLLGKPGEALC